MKGQAKPKRMKNVIKTFQKLLQQYQNTGHTYQIDDPIPTRVSTLAPTSKRFYTAFRGNRPGRKRKLGARAYVKPFKPNPLRRATKPLYAGMPHGTSASGRVLSTPAPWLDQTRTLELRFKRKIIVREGLTYWKGETLPFDYKKLLNAIKSVKILPLPDFPTLPHA